MDRLPPDGRLPCGCTFIYDRDSNKVLDDKCKAAASFYHAMCEGKTLEHRNNATAAYLEHTHEVWPAEWFDGNGRYIGSGDSTKFVKLKNQHTVPDALFAPPPKAPPTTGNIPSALLGD
jgi:hypothetical protein